MKFITATKIFYFIRFRKLPQVYTGQSSSGQSPITIAVSHCLHYLALYAASLLSASKVK